MDWSHGGTTTLQHVPANRTLTIVACPADLTGDGRADGRDLAAFVEAFLAADPAADLNADGRIDVFDLFVMLDGLRDCPAVAG